MAASITVHLQIFKRPQLLHFSTDLDETGIKNHGLLRPFILNIVIIRVAVPFKMRMSMVRTLRVRKSQATDRHSGGGGGGVTIYI